MSEAVNCLTCGKDTYHRVPVCEDCTKELTTMQNEVAELRKDDKALLSEIFCMEAEGVEFMPAADRLKVINKLAHEIYGKAMSRETSQDSGGSDGEY